MLTMADVPMHLKYAALLCVMLLYTLSASAQFLSWDDFVEQLFVEAEGEGEEALVSAENLYDDYMYWHAWKSRVRLTPEGELR